MRSGFRCSHAHSLGLRLLVLRILQSCSQLETRERHKKPPAEAGDDDVREPAASCRSSLGGPPPARRQPGPPGLALTQKAPGGSRGTPGCIPSRLPCEAGSNREIACRHPAWTAGWFSCPESPGFHPGLLVWVPGPEGRVDSKRAQARQANRGTRPRVRVQHAPGFPPGASWATRAIHTKSPRRKPGDSGSHPFPLAMRSGFEPGNCVPSSGMDGGVVFVPGFPGFPPGASWAAEETESQFKGSAKQRSQPG